MTDGTQASLADADEFVRRFRELPRAAQEKRTYAIAERHSSPSAKPDNIEKLAVGIRIALMGQHLPGHCSAYWRNGFKIGQSIREGLVKP